jgi:hypothetical protein
MRTDVILVVVASAMAVAGNVPYIIAMVRREIQPHAYTWLVWSVVSSIVLIGQFTKGAGIGIVPAIASDIFTFIIFFTSLKYGFKVTTKTDTYLLLLALSGVPVWLLTKDATIAVVIAVAVDLIAFVPTFRKTINTPSSESFWLYLMNVCRHILILFTLAHYNVTTTLHSIAMIATNTCMFLFLAYLSFRRT